VRAGVRCRERLAEHVGHPRDALLDGVPVLLAAAVLGPAARGPGRLLQATESAP
jgi:hypothetical protein